MKSRHVLPFAALLLAGCASLRPADNSATQKIDADDTLAVQVVAAAGVTLADDRRQRMAQTIADHVRQRTAKTVADGAVRAWRIELEVTRYDEGSAFQRQMQAGKGAMHIDAGVVLRDAQSGAEAGRVAVNRVYDWGGAMGGQATIVDLEVMTAEHIAKLLTVLPPDEQPANAPNVPAAPGQPVKAKPKAEPGATDGIRRRPW